MPSLIGTAAVLALLVGPLLLGIAGCFAARRSRERATATATGASPLGRLAVASALLYALAFNLVFFVQELWLVVPKAFVPGLHPTLFHNNHRWEGNDPIAALFQGTGALATFAVALACLWCLRRATVRSTTTRLWLVWMAYCGFFMALPQVVVGVLSEGSDLGMAMAWFRLGGAAKTAAALVALALIAVLALQLVRPLLGLAPRASDIDGAWKRTRFVLLVAVLPALVANVLIVPFRVPREWIEVVIVPAVVTVVALPWLVAGAWRVRDAQASGDASTVSVAWPLGLAIALLAIFQLVLRPGVSFY